MLAQKTASLLKAVNQKILQLNFTADICINNAAKSYKDNSKITQLCLTIYAIYPVGYSLQQLDLFAGNNNI